MFHRDKIALGRQENNVSLRLIANFDTDKNVIVNQPCCELHKNHCDRPIRLDKFDQTDREIFESTLKAALGSADFTGLTSTSDLDK